MRAPGRNDLDIPLGGSAMAEVLALSDSLQATVSDAVGVFDATEGFAANGALTSASWLRHFSGARPRRRPLA